MPKQTPEIFNEATEAEETNLFSSLEIEDTPLKPLEVSDHEARVKSLADLEWHEGGDLLGAYTRQYERNKELFSRTENMKVQEAQRFFRSKQAIKNTVEAANTLPDDLDVDVTSALANVLSEERAEQFPIEKSAAGTLSEAFSHDADADTLDEYEHLMLSGGIATKVEVTRRKQVLAQMAMESGADATERGLMFELLDAVLMTGPIGYAAFSATNEKAQQRKGNLVTDFAAFLVPFIDSTSRTNNIPGAPEASLLDQIFAGKHQNIQNSYLMNMSPEEFDEVAPILRDQFLKASTDGGYHNRLQESILLGELSDTPTALMTNTWNALDLLGVAGPVVKGFKGVTLLPKMLKSSGASREAADALALSIKTVQDQGEAGIKLLGSTVDEVAEATLPKALNPTTAADGADSVALGAQQRLAMGQKLSDEILEITTDFSRLGPEERQAAAAAHIDDFIESTGYTPKEINIVNKTLGSGIDTPVLKLSLGTKDGRDGYKSLSRIKALGRSLGFGSDAPVQYVPGKKAGQIDSHPGILAGPDQDPFIKVAQEALERNTTAGIVLNPTRSELKSLLEVAPMHKQGQKPGLKVLSTPDGNIIAGIAESHKDLARSVGLSYEDVGKGYYDPDMTSFNGYLNYDDLKGSVRSFEGSEGKTFRLNTDSEEATEVLKDGVRVTPVKDPDTGRYFLEVEIPFSEIGFFNPLKGTPNRGTVGRKLLGGRQITNEELFGFADISDAQKNKMVSKLRKYIEPKFSALSSRERDLLDNLTLIGDKEGRWLSEADIKTAYEIEFPGSQHTTNKVQEAYNALVELNDLEYYLRNAEVLSRLNAKGLSTVHLRVDGNDTFKNATVSRDPTKVQPQGPIYNVSDGTLHLRDGTDRQLYTAATARDHGYSIVQLQEGLEIQSGYWVKNLLVKTDELTIRPLEPAQINYRAGGHRIYSPEIKHFVKQTAYHTQPNGDKVLKAPRTFKGGKTRSELQSWTNTMNEALHQARRFKATEITEIGVKRILNNIFKGKEGLPSTERFLDDIAEGKLKLDQDFEIVYDRELPSAYSAATDETLEAVSSAYGHMETIGRLYTSKKGEAITDIANKELPLLNVHETLNQSLSNIASTIGMSAYRDRLINKWFETYAPILKKGENSSALRAFSEPNFREGVDPKLLNVAKQEREAGMRVLNWETPGDKLLKATGRNFLQSLDEKTASLGQSSKMRKVALKSANMMNDSNAINKARAWAFDMKLGLYNVRQVWLQATTMLATMSVMPKEGIQAMYGLPMMRMYTASGSKMNKASVIKWFDATGGKAFYGFEDGEEFVKMLDNLRDGFLDIENSHVLMNNSNSDQFMNLGGSTVQKLREGGRWMFFQPEKFNRSVAHAAAWQSIRKKFPGLSVDSQLFKERVRMRASDLSMNMTEASTSSWQKGLWSIPTQFWPYQARMLENMTIGQNFTKGEKFRLAMGQMMLYGSSGVMGFGFLQDQINKANGSTPKFGEEPLKALLDRGLVDGIASSLLGVETNISDSAGTGSFFPDTIAEIFNAGKYGDTSAAEVAAGATGGILGSFGADLMQVYKFSVAERGLGGPMSNEAMIEAMRNISSFNNSYKAYAAKRLNAVISTTGTFMMPVENEDKAMWLSAMGMSLEAESELSAMMGYLNDRTTTEKEFVDLMIKYRTEAEMDWGNSDKVQAKMNITMQLAPPELRDSILKKVYQYPTQSMHESVARNVEQRQNERKIAEGIAKDIEQRKEER